MKLNPGEALLREMYNEVKQAGKAGDSSYYLKPISATKAQSLLQHVAQMADQLEAYKKALDVHIKSTNKVEKASAEMEKICNMKFPESGAKIDLIQERLVKVWSDLRA